MHFQNGDDEHEEVAWYEFNNLSCTPLQLPNSRAGFAALSYLCPCRMRLPPGWSLRSAEYDSTIVLVIGIPQYLTDIVL